MVRAAAAVREHLAFAGQQATLDERLTGVMFLSAIFVPVGGLPTPLRQFAEYNPLSAVATAMRELFHNPAPAVSTPGR